jgi:hypothetical protein
MKPLQMFLLTADKLARCRWNGRAIATLDSLGSRVGLQV